MSAEEDEDEDEEGEEGGEEEEEGGAEAEEGAEEHIVRESMLPAVRPPTTPPMATATLRPAMRRDAEGPPRVAVERARAERRARVRRSIGVKEMG
jgi:hypothetical protein